MKKFIFSISVALAGCAAPETLMEASVTKDTISVTETHFDCIVAECRESKDDAYWVTTECGVVFYSRYAYEPNTILTNFNSPKHQ